MGSEPTCRLSPSGGDTQVVRLDVGLRQTDWLDVAAPVDGRRQPNEGDVVVVRDDVIPFVGDNLTHRDFRFRCFVNVRRMVSQNDPEVGFFVRVASMHTKPYESEWGEGEWSEQVSVT